MGRRRIVLPDNRRPVRTGRFDGLTLVNADPIIRPARDITPFIDAMQQLDRAPEPSLPQLHPAYSDRYDSLVAHLEHSRLLRVAVVEQIYLLQTPRPWVPPIISAVRGHNVFGEPWVAPRPASLGEIVAAEPDVILFAVPGADLYRTQVHVGRLLRDPQWQRAVDGRRVVALDGTRALERAGPGLMNSLELVAWALHHADRSIRPAGGVGGERVGSGWRDLSGFDAVSPTPR